MPDNWIVAIKYLIEESPGSVRTQCQLMTGGVTSGIVPQKINRLIKARVKRRGKSSPVFGNKNAWQTLGARLNREDIALA